MDFKSRLEGTERLIFFFQADSPSGDELSLLGAYLLISLVFVFFTVVEFALILILKEVYEYGSPETGRTNNNSSSEKVISKHLTGQQIPVGQESQLEEIIDDLTRGGVAERRITLLHIIGPKLFRNLPLMRKIDFSAFFIYHFTYVLFNFIYWFICCNLDS